MEKKKRVCEACFTKIDEAQKRAEASQKKAAGAAQSVLDLKDKLASFTGGPMQLS